MTPVISQQSQLPPVTKNPVILQTIQAMFDRFGLLERYHRRYGDIFYTLKSSLFPPFVIFNDPQAIEQVFTFWRGKS